MNFPHSLPSFGWHMESLSTEIGFSEIDSKTSDFLLHLFLCPHNLVKTVWSIVWLSMIMKGENKHLIPNSRILPDHSKA
jgi:hypothetical protein